MIFRALYPLLLLMPAYGLTPPAIAIVTNVLSVTPTGQALLSITVLNAPEGTVASFGGNAPVPVGSLQNLRGPYAVTMPGIVSGQAPVIVTVTPPNAPAVTFTLGKLLLGAVSQTDGTFFVPTS